MFYILYKNDYSSASHIAKYRWVTYETYVMDQYKVGTYADEISAQALANSLNINVTVIGTSDGLQNSVNTFFSGRRSNTNTTITIVNRSGSHFYGTKSGGSGKLHLPKMQEFEELHSKNKQTIQDSIQDKARNICNDILQFSRKGGEKHHNCG
jgi:hypothetical protein